MRSSSRACRPTASTPAPAQPSHSRSRPTASTGSPCATSPTTSPTRLRPSPKPSASCRSGIVIAEPWLDLELPSQRVAHRFDTWLEAREAERGGIHRVPRRPAELLAALPPEVTVEMHCHLDPPRPPSSWLQEKAAPYQPLHPEAAAELHAIEAAAHMDGLTFNGTAILVATLESGTA